MNMTLLPKSTGGIVADWFAAMVVAVSFLVGLPSAAFASERPERVEYTYDAPVHIYDGAAHSVQAHAGEVPPGASGDASDSVQETVAAAVGQLSVVFLKSVAADSAPHCLSTLGEALAP